MTFVIATHIRDQTSDTDLHMSKQNMIPPRENKFGVSPLTCGAPKTLLKEKQLGRLDSHGSFRPTDFLRSPWLRSQPVL